MNAGASAKIKMLDRSHAMLCVRTVGIDPAVGVAVRDCGTVDFGPGAGSGKKIVERGAALSDLGSGLRGVRHGVVEGVLAIIVVRAWMIAQGID